MGAARSGRQPSHPAYYVALGGVIVLLILLLSYFFYFCVRRVKELSHATFPEPVRSVRPSPPPPKPSSQTYPVQPGVRESATAMARLCQVTPSHTDTVYPSPRSPGRHSAGTLPQPRSPGRHSAGTLPQPRSPGRHSAGTLLQPRSPGRHSAVTLPPPRIISRPQSPVAIPVNTANVPTPADVK